MDTTPKPQAPVDPRAAIEKLHDLERAEQIKALEEIHHELAKQLNRAQA